MTEHVLFPSAALRRGSHLARNRPDEPDELARNRRRDFRFGLPSRNQPPEPWNSRVTFVASGAPREGEEDVACAELMAASLMRLAHSRESAVAAVVGSRAAAKHQAGDLDFPPEDIDCAVAIDAFDFAMKAERESDRWIARPYFP